MQSYPLSAVANGTGVATAQLPSRAVTKRWTIKMVHVESDSATTSRAVIYINNQPLVGTTAGNFDDASGDPPVPITGKDNVQIQWINCSTGANCTAVVWYDDAVH